MKKRIFSCVAGLFFGLGSLASGSIIDVESANNTYAGAYNIVINTQGTYADPFSDTGVMTLAAGGYDVDYFAINLLQGQILTVSTTPLTRFLENPNTLLGVFDQRNNKVAENDDSYGKGSLIQYQAPMTGTYYIAVTGSGDSDFNGYVGSTGHGVTGMYQMLVGVVPEPATLTLLGIMGIGLIAGRRK
jgi:hypothetical protein